MSRGLERESSVDGRSWYSPHRALIALGTILISIAIAGGLLGVVNATHAVQETATLSNRYLVLQPPIGTLRADVAVFQGLADSAFAGADATPTFLAKAVQASDATDQAYGTVRRLFDKLGDKDLEPHLAASMAAYVAIRARLADFLSVGTSSAEKAAIVTAERTSATNLDNAIANSQAAVTTRLESTATQAQAAGNAAKIDLLLCLLVGGVLGIGFTSLFAWKALTVEREDNRNRAVRARITRRNEFEGRLQRALEMAKSESSVYDLVSEALVDAAPTCAPNCCSPTRAGRTSGRFSSARRPPMGADAVWSLPMTAPQRRMVRPWSSRRARRLTPVRTFAVEIARPRASRSVSVATLSGSST